MLLLAHRGSNTRAPENTLEAFRFAVEEGADGVELDVMRCGSGELVVCHDERLGRLAGVDWEIARTPWWKLQRADVGRSLGVRARIPLLEQVFALLPTRMVVNVEIKTDRLNDGGLAEQVGAFLSDHDLGGRVICSSFNALSLLRLASRFPLLRRGYLLDPNQPYWVHGGLIAPIVATFSIHPHFQACSQARVRAWQAGGRKVAAWTVNDPQVAQKLEAWGVDYLITDQVRAVQSRVTTGNR